MRTYVILGANCCFAQHTSLALLKMLKTERVIGVGRHAPSWSHRIVMGDLERYSYAVFDIRRTDEIVAFLKTTKPAVIINFAAEGESGASFDDPAKYFDTNTTASVRLVEGLRDAPWLRRFVQISTGEVYGSAESPARESDPLRPTSPYAASKAAFDHYLVALHKRRCFPVNIVRPCNTYGEGQQLFRIVPKAVMFGLLKRQMPLYGCGLGEKSYMHATDLARGIVKVATQAPLGRIYNLGPRMPIATRDVIRTVADVLRMPPHALAYEEGHRRGTDARYWFDCQAAERDLNWTPEISLDEGVRSMVEWHRQHIEFLTAQLDVELKRQPVPQTIGVG